MRFVSVRVSEHANCKLELQAVNDETSTWKVMQ